MQTAAKKTPITGTGTTNVGLDADCLRHSVIISDMTAVSSVKTSVEDDPAVAVFKEHDLTALTDAAGVAEFVIDSDSRWLKVAHTGSVDVIVRSMRA